MKTVCVKNFDELEKVINDKNEVQPVVLVILEDDIYLKEDFCVSKNIILDLSTHKKIIDTKGFLMTFKKTCEIR